MMVSGFFISALCTIILDRSILKFYLITTASIYYGMALVKSPGSLFDINDSDVKGICNKCNRIRGDSTKHCTVCNKCYYKRDHHCVFLGKCVASNNIKDFFFCLLFTFLYSIAMLLTKPHKILLIFATTVIGMSLFWFATVISTGKSTSELLELEKWSFSIRCIGSLFYELRDRPHYILFPFLRIQHTVDY
ncbi:ERFB [Enterospora canceri]|uniref:Palmitoyltransferase n=1 Tax=Enterospora canceri TaxID=1081671 RepID=A0A1Y1S6Q3_9MICR|nr:ERFB [Enterospora canceri]